MRYLIPVLAAVFSVLSTAPVKADLGDQLFKLLPDDGEAGDTFGYSVATSGEIIIVGAFEDNDNGTDSGSAYLFDFTTGRQLLKLLADDGAPEDRFGTSVAISPDGIGIANCRTSFAPNKGACHRSTSLRAQTIHASADFS